MATNDYVTPRRLASFLTKLKTVFAKQSDVDDVRDSLEQKVSLVISDEEPTSSCLWFNTNI